MSILPVLYPSASSKGRSFMGGAASCWKLPCNGVGLGGVGGAGAAGLSCRTGQGCGTLAGCGQGLLSAEGAIEPLPCVPPQGAIMPLSFDSGTYTDLATQRYTLTLVATVPIAPAILFRFQIFDGLNTTYEAAVAASEVAEMDVVVEQPIAAGTVMALALTATATSLVSLDGVHVYGAGTSGSLYPDAIRALSANHTCLAWAYAPKATTFPNSTWVPSSGQPQFNIGYAWQTPAGPDTCPTVAGLTPAQTTAPNVPDQWSEGQRWTWLYEVVFPVQFNVNGTGADTGNTRCVTVTAIKVAGNQSVFVPGSWTALRDVIAEPWTALQTNASSPARWEPYRGTRTQPPPADPVVFDAVPEVGPLVFAATPGQLAVVYFRPRAQQTACNPAEVDTVLLPAPSPGPWTSPAQLGLLVTSPLPPHTTLYFTVEPYNAALSGFGLANPLVASDSVCAGSTSFVTHAPSFEWHTGSCTLPAGTVVFIDNIGSAEAGPTIVDAHFPGQVPSRVGVLTNYTLGLTPGGNGSAVPSIIITSDWVNYGPGAPRPLVASRFVTAVTSDQYTGDAPPLSPMITMPGTRAVGAVAYGLGQVFNGCGLPGTAQAAIINSTPWEEVLGYVADAVQPTDMPVFTGMQDWQW